MLKFTSPGDLAGATGRLLGTPGWSGTSPKDGARKPHFSTPKLELFRSPFWGTFRNPPGPPKKSSGCSGTESFEVHFRGYPARGILQRKCDTVVQKTARRDPNRAWFGTPFRRGPGEPKWLETRSGSHPKRDPISTTIRVPFSDPCWEPFGHRMLVTQKQSPPTTWCPA